MPFDPQAFVGKYGTPPASGGGAAGGFDPAAFVAKHGGGATPSSDVLQEMHPDFTAADRLVVGNFANGEHEAATYLQKQHPQLDVQVDPESNQIKARRKDGSDGGQWRTLNPKTGVWGTLSSPKELALTLGSHAYDLASGVGTTAAAAAAGLAATPETLGVGTLPAAAAGGAAAGAGFEGLREGLGKLLGIDQDFNTGHIVAGGVAGAAAPVLFGTGATAAQIAAKAAESGMEPAAVAAAQRGLLGRGLDLVKGPLGSAAAKLGSMTSGVAPDTIKTFAEDPAAIAAMEQNPRAITEAMEGTTRDLGGKIREAKAAAWNTYQSALGGAGTEPVIDAQAVANPLKNAIAAAQAEADRTKTEASQETLSRLKDLYKRHFLQDVTTEAPGAPVATGLLNEFGQPITTEGAAVKTTVQKPLERLTPLDAAKLDQKLSDLANYNAIKPGSVSGGVGNRFSNTATAEDKAVAEIAGQMKQLLGGQLENVLPPEALAAKAQYGTIANLEKRAKPLLSDAGKAFNSLRNADKTPNVAKLELFHELDQTFGTSLLDQAKNLQAYSAFGKPSAVPLSAAGATSTSRSIPMALAGAGLGSMVGYKEGGAPGALAGGAAGGALGGFVGGPAALRRYIETAMKLKGVGASLPNALTPAAATSAWNMMGGTQ